MPIETTTSSNRRTAASPDAVVDDVFAGLAAPAATNLARWLAFVATGDFCDLSSIMAPDAIYHSPVEWRLYPGRDLVCLLVQTAASVFEDFKYLRQFGSGRDAVLEFSARVGEIEMRGVHILRFDDAGEIVDIDLIARPAKGVMALGNGVASRAGPQIMAALAAAPTSDAQLPH